MYVNGQLVIDNDGSMQLPTRRCRMKSIISGVHYLQIEGWSGAVSASFVLTYNGPDTLNKTVPFTPIVNPRAPSLQVPTIKDCSPSQANRIDGPFTICGFKAAENVDLQKVDDFVANYLSVRTRAFPLNFVQAFC